jgi:putative membrane protein
LPFIQEAASANLMEVSAGKIAESRAARPGVKDFGKRMVSDHSSIQQQLTTMTSNNGVAFTPALDAQQQQEISRLQTLSGAEFDRTYMGLTVRNQRDNVTNFQNERRVARSAEVREFIDRNLVTVQNNLTLAQQLGSQVGADVLGDVATLPDTTSAISEDRKKDRERASQGNVRADAKFIRDVDASHFLQIRLARLAQDKARDGAVKRFAKQMEEDHSAFQKQWSNMASRNGMEFKSGMGPDHRARLDLMEKMLDKDFDRAYMSMMIQNHNGYLNYWRKEGRGAHSAPVRQLVNRGIPTLEEHMAMAKRIGKQVGVDVEAALAGRRIAAD